MLYFADINSELRHIPLLPEPQTHFPIFKYSLKSTALLLEPLRSPREEIDVGETFIKVHACTLVSRERDN